MRQSVILRIPKTVTSITGASSRLVYSQLFAIELVFTIIAFVLVLITVNILLPRYHKSNSEYMLTGNQMAAVILYVVIQTAFGILANRNCFRLKYSRAAIFDISESERYV